MTAPLPSVEAPELPPADAGPPVPEVATAAPAVSREREFRFALSRFATGVTVVTALTPDRLPIGVTISSFNSVSLDPQLILWSLSLNSPKLEAFRDADRYVVNVLSAGQRDISDRFAARNEDRFAGLAQHGGLDNVPVLEGCCAWFECSNAAHYPGGDHLIFLGRVERFAVGETAEPLVFHGGQYRHLVHEDGT